ncbi:hypothetical protein RUM44_009198 [Polyplax serrata]|uniref:Uncharacterized protein n=1 Tax=Polyplax serrata TaxID=468196 RepID=A0ABR1ASN0_POLSC
MSPASQGSLEIEHYIGSNLISSCARVNNSRSNGKGRKQDGKLVLQRTNLNQNSGGDVYQRHGGGRQGYPVANILSSCACRGNININPRAGQFRAAGWTGVPLISVADGKNKNHQYQDRTRNVTTEDDSTLRTPLSRLAIHTQGAPLILSGRCYNARKNQNRTNQGRGGELVIRRSDKYKDNISHGGTSDCLSVASDESSGSGHSENCLPRIIKPRKRRKKDRKPSIASAENYEETGRTSSEGGKPFCGKKVEPEAEKNPQKCDTKSNLKLSGSKISNGSQRDEASEDDSHGPELRHTFEDVIENESLSYGCLPSSCQCHYCDPSGIWDAPSNFFSKQAEKASVFLTPPPDSNKSFHYFPHSDLVLRRSWSEPIPEPQSRNLGLSMERQALLPSRSHSFCDSATTKSKTWLEKPETGQSESSKSGSPGEKVNLGYRSPCLEVSTEIVTSPNGHRDLEIRFYTTSSSS